MQHADFSAWLALHTSSLLTDKILRQLIMAAPQGPQPIFELTAAELVDLDINPEIAPALDSIRKGLLFTNNDSLLQTLEIQGVQILPLSAPDYPELLKQINDPPPILYVRGNRQLLQSPQIAMVGSRRTSRAGGDNAYRFAAELSRNGFTITSGLALGIDAASHRGALATSGRTVAVLGTGIDVVYPARNRQLFEEIADCGAIISEFAPGMEPRRPQFPRRNRIISGLSLGVLVVEAALQSGSLISARCALEQGREVFAIPGSIHSTSSKGCHALIRQGAKLVETTADILEELAGWLPGGEEEVRSTASDQERLSSIDEPQVLSAKERQLLKLIGFDPAPVDLLQQHSGWPMAELNSLLMTLELKQLIENIAGCYYRVN